MTSWVLEYAINYLKTLHMMSAMMIGTSGECMGMSAGIVSVIL
jgi:hypothetical protein